MERWSLWYFVITLCGATSSSSFSFKKRRDGNRAGEDAAACCCFIWVVKWLTWDAVAFPTFVFSAAGQIDHHCHFCANTLLIVPRHCWLHGCTGKVQFQCTDLCSNRTHPQPLYQLQKYTACYTIVLAKCNTTIAALILCYSRTVPIALMLQLCQLQQCTGKVS